MDCGRCYLGAPAIRHSIADSQFVQSSLNEEKLELSMVFLYCLGTDNGSSWPEKPTSGEKWKLKPDGFSS